MGCIAIHFDTLKRSRYLPPTWRTICTSLSVRFSIHCRFAADKSYANPRTGLGPPVSARNRPHLPVSPWTRPMVFGTRRRSYCFGTGRWWPRTARTVFASPSRSRAPRRWSRAESPSVRTTPLKTNNNNPFTSRNGPSKLVVHTICYVGSKYLCFFSRGKKPRNSSVKRTKMYVKFDKSVNFKNVFCEFFYSFIIYARIRDDWVSHCVSVHWVPTTGYDALYLSNRTNYESKSNLLEKSKKMQQYIIIIQRALRWALISSTRIICFTVWDRLMNVLLSFKHIFSIYRCTIIS